MPLGAARITLLAFSPSVEAEATVIRGKKSFITVKDPAISTDQSKFGGSSAEFVGTHSSSGTSDVIRTNQSSDFIFEGDFTWECWVYFVDNGTNDGMVIMSNRGSFATHNLYVQARHSDNKWQWGNSTMGANVTSQTWNYNTWYHVAIVRSGSSVDNFALYVNGTSLQTDTDTNTIGLAGTSDYIALGAIYNASTPSFGLNGFIDEVRISPIARYTGSFTPSTTPFVNDEDTVLLAHMDGTDGSTFFEDDNGVDRSAVGVTAINNAQVDTAYSQFGGSSLKVDGVDDALTALFDNTFDASGDFCIELWARGSGYGPRGKLFATYPHHSSLADSIFIDVSGGNTIRCYINGANRVTTGTWSNTTWTHVALQRTGQVFEMFVGGTRVLNYDGGTPKDYSMDNSASFHLGGTFSSGTTYNDEWNGHFDELRFSDTARYTSGSSITVPTAPFVNDDNTALLLHMNGTDASTFFEDDNGAFSSSSTRTAKTSITVKDPEISTDQSKFGGSSAKFVGAHSSSGTSDVIRTEQNSDFIFTGDFTWECWVYFVDNGTNDGMVIMSNRGSFASHNLYVQARHSDQKWQWGNSTMGANVTTQTWNYNTWYHVAIVRSGSGSGNFAFYVNGTALQTDTDTNTIGSSGGSDYIALGAIYNATTPSFGLNGYIDEVRISPIARYTGTFTPSTVPFENDSNTVLLMHMEGADASTDFTDDTITKTGRSPVGISAIGQAQVDTAQYQFGGSSVYVDGSGDYLQINDTPTFGADDFTIEFWWRPTSKVHTYPAMWVNMNGYSTGAIHICDRHNSYSTKFSVFLYHSSISLVSSTTVSNNTWYHIALCRDGGTIRLFINGTAEASSSISGDIGDSTRTFHWLGRNSNYFVNGHMDELRVSNTARYTGSFTPHTTPHLNDANTIYLLHMDGTDGTTVFRDDNGQVRSPVGVSAQQQVQIDTAQSKFGSSSALFDGGTDDYILVDHNTQNIDYGGDFTYEFWFRTGTLPSLFYMFAQGSTRGDYISLYNKSGTWTLAAPVSVGSSVYTQIRNIGSTPSTNTWYHIALVKDGATLKMFWNGTELTTNNDSAGTMSADKGWDGIRRIGDWGGGSNYAFNGHMDEVRFSNSVRYTSNFTPSTTPFVNDADTLLLMHMDGTDASTTFIDDNGKIEPGLTYSGDSYASSVKLAVPFDSTHGMDDVSHSLIGSTSTQATLTDGAASSLSTTQVKWTLPDYGNSYLGDIGLGSANTYALSTSIPASSSGTFVVEGWFYANNSTSNSNWCLSSGESGGRWLFGINNGSTFQFGNENNIGIGSGWHHLAIVCDGGTKRFYYDGIYKGAWVSSNTGFSTLHVGQFNAGDGNDFRGHIQDLKVTIGSIRGYTGTSTSSANFALPRSIVLQYA